MLVYLPLLLVPCLDVLAKKKISGRSVSLTSKRHAEIVCKIYVNENSPLNEIAKSYTIRNV